MRARKISFTFLAPMVLQSTYTERKKSSEAKPNRNDNLGNDVSLVLGLVVIFGSLSNSHGSHDDEVE